jgi:microcystin-dependent protein
MIGKLFDFRLITLSLLFLFVAVPDLGFSADVPEMVHYEGFLSDGNGYAVADGNYQVTFRIYDSFTGTTALWEETWGSGTSPVPIVNGRFRILLGSHVPLTSAFFQQHPNTFLGITVGSDPEMAPRQRIASVPYALSTPGSSVPSGVILMWSGELNNIPSGWALCDGTNGTPDLRDRFIVGAGTSYDAHAFGGRATQELTIENMPNHSHIIDPPSTNTNTTGNHSHSLSLLMSNDDATSSGFREGQMTVTRSYGTSSAGAHSHTVNIAQFNSGLTGGSQPLEILPPYYALVFIMKL